MRRIDEERFVVLADDSWFQLIGLRNIISHGYETINFAMIWQMITEELPELSKSWKCSTTSKRLDVANIEQARDTEWERHSGPSSPGHWAITFKENPC